MEFQKNFSSPERVLPNKICPVNAQEQLVSTRTVCEVVKSTSSDDQSAKTNLNINSSDIIKLLLQIQNKS